MQQEVIESLAFILFGAGLGTAIVLILLLLLHCSSSLPAANKGLSASELKKLPRLTGNDLTTKTECAICLDDIEGNQSVRVIPVCKHGFHLQCADNWLSLNPVCPLCRGLCVQPSQTC